MKILSLWILLSLLIFFMPQGIIASEGITNCDNRFVTLVNPVRGRNLWTDKSINPLKSQYVLVKKYGFPATWLLQYDVLKDEEVISEIKNFDSLQEAGVFLEVSEDYAKQSRVIYPHAVPWFSPQAVFLSGYTQSDRRKLIDKLFEEFKQKFGFYPKSVGAWWIDSYSLDYLRNKYGISSAMIVADQKTTDNYGVWGQWWGVPYYPAKANILTPASSLSNKLDVLVIQWAQRDPVLAVGNGPAYSNYSLQANDYIRQGKDTGYFKQLVNTYLDCKNPLGQVTVGLETGLESIGYLEEYWNQLDILKKINNLQFVTMNQLVQRFAKVYPSFPLSARIEYEDSVWELATSGRINKKLGDRIKYNSGISFEDYFIADTSNFLNRKLPTESVQKNISNYPLFLWGTIVLGVICIIKKKFLVWISSMLFAFPAFGLILRSHYQYGWKIYYGPVVPSLESVQLGLILISFVGFLAISRKYRMIYLIPLSFGLDPLIQSLRFSSISDKLYFGIAFDALRFVGFNISSARISYINQDLPSYQAAALLKFNFDKIWNNLLLSFTVYPVVHLLLGILFIFILSKIPSRVRVSIVTISVGLFIWHLNGIVNADPRLVLPNLLK